MTFGYTDWEPIIATEVDSVGEGPSLALHGLVASERPEDPCSPGRGEVLPALWHWLAFLPRVPQRDIGQDGHPRLGSFMPPVLLPRRMFAGGRVHIRAPLLVAEQLERTSKVVSVVPKRGRSGELCFVTVRHEISGAGGGFVEEEQDIVYREASPSPSSPSSPPPQPPQPKRPAPTEPVPESGGGFLPEPELGPRQRDGLDLTAWTWRRQLEITPTLLFRFSALTYNAHRIHYDRDFARAVEGYPALVVHGPLQAVMLAALCEHESGRPLTQFAFQASSPAFESDTLTFVGCRSESAGGLEAASGPAAVELQAMGSDGVVTMRAHAVPATG